MTFFIYQPYKLKKTNKIDEFNGDYGLKNID